MKIGIDTFGCGHGRSGAGTYLASLCAHLPEGGEFQFELFGSEMDRYTYSKVKSVNYRAVPGPDNLAFERIWHLFHASRFIKKARYDCALFPAGARLPLRSYPFPAITVVHTAFSSLSARHGEGWLKFQVIPGLKRVSRVIATSQFVRKDLSAHGIDPAKIEVVHNGIDHSLFFPREAPDQVDAKPFAIKRPYFVYATSFFGPEKKHVELIKAFDQFKLETGLPHRLVLAGSDGPAFGAVQKGAAKSRFASDIFLTGYFPHESLPQLYAAADACVFPASGEGSGLPVLEAMAVGIPCACAKSGVLPEIAGSHALFFNNENTLEMAQALQKIVTDQDLRKNLISGGLDWTNRLSWEKTAVRTMDVIKSVLA